MKQAGSNHKKPLLRIWLERGSLRPLHTRLGSELINVLPVWLGAVEQDRLSCRKCSNRS